VDGSIVPRGDENVTPIAATPFILSEALPVVPPKLVKRIVRGDYIDMAEMLSDNMELERRRALAESEGIANVKQSGRREIPDVLSWLHCFSLYAAVLCTRYPDKAKQLWAYQALMITETRRCGGRGWRLYDTTFRQQLTSLETADFAKLNDSLYATTFLAYGTKRQCCPNCLLPDHSAEECALYNPRPMAETGIAPVGSVMRGGYEEKPVKGGEWRRKRSRRGACYAWNDGKCGAQHCQYDHVCSRCYGDHKRPMCPVESKQEGRNH